MIIVKSGRVTQYLEQESRELGPGDSVYIDRDVVHGSYNDSDATAELQVVLAPRGGRGRLRARRRLGRRALGEHALTVQAVRVHPGGAWQPVADSVFPLGEIEAAHGRMEGADHSASSCSRAAERRRVGTDGPRRSCASTG